MSEQIVTRDHVLSGPRYLVAAREVRSNHKVPVGKSNAKDEFPGGGAISDFPGGGA